jgi:hypothetical protein
MVKRGYGQVEPNHLSAQRTAEIYAQLPAEKDIMVLENGQFVKYNYAAGVVDFKGIGEWMLVYNEIKLYRDWETDEDWAMMKRDYNAYVYSPIGQNSDGSMTADQLTKKFGNETYPVDPDHGRLPVGATWEREVLEEPAYMREGEVMVPRVFKTHEGDIFTTNTIAADFDSVKVGDLLKPNEFGYLTTGATEEDNFVWQIVKKYTLPDLQPAVKVMRVK